MIVYNVRAYVQRHVIDNEVFHFAADCDRSGNLLTPSSSILFGSDLERFGKGQFPIQSRGGSEYSRARGVAAHHAAPPTSCLSILRHLELPLGPQVMRPGSIGDALRSGLATLTEFVGWRTNRRTA